MLTEHLQLLPRREIGFKVRWLVIVGPSNALSNNFVLFISETDLSIVYRSHRVTGTLIQQFLIHKTNQTQLKGWSYDCSCSPLVALAAYSSMKVCTMWFLLSSQYNCVRIGIGVTPRALLNMARLFKAEAIPNLMSKSFLPPASMEYIQSIKARKLRLGNYTVIIKESIVALFICPCNLHVRPWFSAVQHLTVKILPVMLFIDCCKCGILPENLNIFLGPLRRESRLWRGRRLIRFTPMINYSRCIQTCTMAF